MSIAELPPVTVEDRIQSPVDATPEVLASMIAVPDLESLQTYLVMRFGASVLQLAEADQAELYQMDVSGASNAPPVFEPPVQVNWSILRGEG